GVEVVVGTPGRLIDLMKQGHLQLGQVKTLVLDEADEMLDMGFLPDVERLVAKVSPVRQTMLFSATMPGSIIALARRYMSQPTHIRAINPDDENSTVDAIEQHVWRAHNLDKPELLGRVLQAEGRGLTMIFCRTKRNAQRVADDLVERGFAAAAVHGDLGQGAREQALRAFRNGKVDVLVATDVAARGIDVADVTHVINWECPEDEKTYLHRIGRTGRAGNSGVAITLVDWDDLHRWKMIAQALGLPFEEPIETYSSSPHIYTGLNIPEGTKGRLPKSARTREGLDAEVIEDLGETGAAAGKRNRSGPKGRDDKHGKGGRDGGRDGKGRSDRPKADRDPRPEGTDDSAGSDEPREPRQRRERQRTRTRGGASAAAASAEGAASAPTVDGGSDHGPEASDNGEGTGAPRRRRRRGGRGRGKAAAGEGGSSSAGEPASAE
ncbi:MAG: DEAD/DEAH box helicase, partial [Candidatus Nanopelagicales bacterium]